MEARNSKSALRKTLQLQRYLFVVLALFPLFAWANYVVGVTEHSAKPVYKDELLSTVKKPMMYLDQVNQRVQLGLYSAGKFQNVGIFELARGSAFAQSKQMSTIQTVNLMILYSGQVVVSYDQRSDATSVFVIEGKARVYNIHHSDRSVHLTMNQGAVLRTKELYPTQTTQMVQAKVDSWLQNFGWPVQFRKNFVKNLPETLTQRHVASEQGETRKAENRAATKEIEKLISTVTPDGVIDESATPGPDYYERLYGAPALLGRNETDLETKYRENQPIQEMTPEEAAYLRPRTPRITIDLGLPGKDQVVIGERSARDIASSSKMSKRKSTAASKKKRNAAKSGKVRSLASVVKQVQDQEKRRQSDPDVKATLQQLKRVGNERSTETDYDHGVRSYDLSDNYY